MNNDLPSHNKEVEAIYTEYSNNMRTMHGRNYFSQAGQDLFVLEMLSNKKSGFYIEIGGADPFESNNTFLLEKNYSWQGFSIEFDKVLASRYNSMRTNPCFCDDATTYDYHSKVKLLNFPTQIDYLSVDIDPVENTYLALNKCPFDRHRFSVITFEHDAYASGTEYMELSRAFLESRAYQLVAKNVKCFGRDFEDWWIDPNVIPESTWTKFVSNGKEFSSIFEAK